MERLETTVQRYNWAARRIIGAHSAGSRIMTILFLFMLIFANNVQFATAADTKTKTQLSPTITITQTDEQKTAIVGQIKYERPSLTIKDASGKLISRYFKLNWSFENGRDSVDASGREYSVDKTTGSVISKLYDGVTIGDTAGTAKVIVTLTIAPLYEDTYEFASGAQTSASYTVVVKSPTVTADYYNGSTLLSTSSTLLLHSYTNQYGKQSTTSIPVPTPYFHYDLENATHDVSSYYDYTYETTSGFSVSNGKITTTYSATDVAGTLTIKATPKKEYQKMLGTAEVTTTVALKNTYLTSPIKTYIKFASHEQDVLRFRNAQKVKRGGQQSTYSPDLIITDAEGNDITSLVTRKDLFTVTTAAQNAFNKYTTDPHDSTDENNYLYKENKDVLNAGVIQDGARLYVQANIHNHPDDYIITVTAREDGQTVFGASCYASPVAASGTTTINGQFYNQYDEKCKENQYTINENQYVLRVHKRVPKIVLTPDPSTVTIAEKYVMNGFNRFQIKGEVIDTYDTDDPVDTVRYDKSQFTYWFFVPNKYKYDTSKTEAENEEIATKEGHALIKVETVADKQSQVKDSWEWVPEYDKDGNPVLYENGQQKKDLLHGTYYFSMNGWGNEAFTVTFYGQNVTAPVIYKINPWNQYTLNVGVSGSYAFHVVKQEPTHFVIDPQKQVGSINTTLPCPDIKVEDQFNVDITSYFTVTKKKNSDTDACTLNTDGSVTSSTKDSYDIIVSGAVTDAENTNGRYFENPANSKYTMVFEQGSTGSNAAYEVIYDKDHNEKMGKLHFIKAGDFFPGTTAYHEVPGINITFGSADDTKNDKDNVWTLIASPITADYFSDDTEFKGADNDNDWADKTKNKLQKMSITANATTFGDNNLPTGGGFLKIEAVTNGWLYIDGNFQYDTETKKGRHYIIVDASSKEQQTIGYIKNPDKPDADNVAEVKFPKPLLAGHTYYIYTDDGGMRIHGLRFEPGFIDPVTDALPWAHPGAVDTEPVVASTAFLNGYTGNLPALTFHQPDPTVRWYCDDVKADNTNTNLTTSDIVQCKDKEGKHVNISNTNGIVLGKAMTNEAPLNDASRKGYANGRVRVYGEVKGIKHSNGDQVMKTPEYYLFVGDMPTYIVQDGENHDQDERVSTTNIPTRIWMTFGGWHWTSNPDYPYYKGDNPKNPWLDDEWKTAKMDSVGHNGQTVDGFNFITWGAQNPSDEHVCGWDESNRNTFNLPVRGTYLKFEPEESGRLLLYLCMNGMTDISNSDTDAKKKKSGPWLRRRALYIVDETGKPVAIDDNSGWESKYTWGNYVNSGKTNSYRFPGYTNYYQNYYCDGVTRAAWEYKVGDTDTHLDIWDKADKPDDKDKKYSWMKAYDRNHDGKLEEAEQNNLNADYEKIKGWWTSDTYAHPDKTSDGSEIKMSFTHPKLGGPLELIQLSDSSYVLPTKGYVRFTFEVYAGKVYYVFMTGSKLGFCGFGFIPAHYRANMNKWTDYSGEAKNADGTAFTDETYAKLPQPDATTDNLYLAGKSGNTRLMGGAKTLDVALTADNAESYAKWKNDGFALSDNESTTTSGSSTTKSGESTTTKNTARDFVNVTLKRTFRNQRWAGICLPFTVSETQMKSIFGDDMQLVTVDSVMASKDHERTLHLTQHANQLLEAGRPYLIKPNVSGKADGEAIGDESTTDGTHSVTFKGVTVESVKPMTVVLRNEEVIEHNKAVENGTDKGAKVEIFTYQISGQYDKAIIPWYSYYMKNSEDKDKNKFYRIMQPAGSTAKGRNLPGCNIWLYPYSYDAEGDNRLTPDGGSTTVNPAKLADLWITGAEVAGNTTTGIDEIVDDLNAATTTAFPGVYDLQGRQVRATNSLQGLAPGIYLMGGRKYVVK